MKDEEIYKQLEELCKDRITIISHCGYDKEGQFISWSDLFNHSVFDGMMLSDGYIEKRSESSSARFRLSCKYEEFARCFANYTGIGKNINLASHSYSDKRTNKTYTGYRLDSKSNYEFVLQHTRWYPNGKKIVPRDIILDRTTLLWWYLGDGHLNKKKARPNYRRVVLSTQGFVNEDIDFLKSKVVEKFGEDSVYIENRNIIIGRKALCKFAKEMGNKSPVNCYQYKFDFGPYVDENYWEKSFEDRPLKYINEYRRKNKVRELKYTEKREISHDK